MILGRGGAQVTVPLFLPVGLSLSFCLALESDLLCSRYYYAQAMVQSGGSWSKEQRGSEPGFSVWAAASLGSERPEDPQRGAVGVSFYFSSLFGKHPDSLEERCFDEVR